MLAEKTEHENESSAIQERIPTVADSFDGSSPVIEEDALVESAWRGGLRRKLLV